MYFGGVEKILFFYCIKVNDIDIFPKMCYHLSQAAKWLRGLHGGTKGFSKWEKLSATGPFQSTKTPILRRDITAVGWLCMRSFRRSEAPPLWWICRLKGCIRRLSCSWWRSQSACSFDTSTTGAWF